MSRFHRFLAHTYLDISLIAFVLFLLPQQAFCRIEGIPDLKKLTADSNLIAVVEVVGVRELGAGTFSDSQGNSFQGLRKAATFHLEEVIKGQNDANSIEVNYDFSPGTLFNLGPVTPDFHPGTRMIIFLKCSPQGCHITDSEHAGFAVARKTTQVPDPPERTPYYRVLQRIAAGLLSDDAVPSASNRQANRVPFELFLLSFQRDPYINTISHAALDHLDKNTTFQFRGQLLAALVGKGDTAALPQLEEALFTGDPAVASNARSNMILALQGVDWHQSLPIAARALQLRVADLRVEAAYIIKFLETQPFGGQPQSPDMKSQATQALMTALHDPDSDVVFAVMQSLGVLNGRLDQRPTSPKPDDQWISCLHFWETFPADSRQ